MSSNVARSVGVVEHGVERSGVLSSNGEGMRGEVDPQLPFEERILRDIENSVRVALDFLRNEREGIEKNGGPAHEHVRSISSVMDRLEQAVLLLGALPRRQPAQSYSSIS